ncbi:hypothetical protein DMENIID0001_030970 [Sergentomyia squamirostris]
MICKIIFDKNNGVYIAGDTITGRVEVTINHPKNIRLISLIIRGKVEVKWSQTESYIEFGESKTKSVIYSSEEDYLNSEIILFGKHGGPANHLPVGTHSYAFTCVLPLGLPGTIVGDYGKIWYDAKVKISHGIAPFAIDDTFKRDFTVISMVNLNQDRTLNIPSEVKKIEKYRNWKLTTSPIVLKAKVPKSGFAIKEVIPITVNIKNLSTVDIKGVHAKLVKEIVFTSRSPQRRNKMEKSKIVSKKYDLTAKRKKETIDIAFKLTVPQTPLTGCQSSFIKISYHVEVVVYVSGFHSTVQISIPVTLGTYPIGSGLSENTVIPQIATPISNMLPPVNFPRTSPMLIPERIYMHPTAPPASYSSLNLDDSIETPPPTYHEVMYGWQGNEMEEQKPSAPSY